VPVERKPVSVVNAPLAAVAPAAAAAAAVAESAAAEASSPQSEQASAPATSELQVETMDESELPPVNTNRTTGRVSMALQARMAGAVAFNPGALTPGAARPRGASQSGGILSGSEYYGDNMPRTGPFGAAPASSPSSSSNGGDSSPATEVGDVDVPARQAGASFSRPSVAGARKARVSNATTPKFQAPSFNSGASADGDVARSVSVVAEESESVRSAAPSVAQPAAQPEPAAVAAPAAYSAPVVSKPAASFVAPRSSVSAAPVSAPVSAPVAAAAPAAVVPAPAPVPAPVSTAPAPPHKSSLFDDDDSKPANLKELVDEPPRPSPVAARPSVAAAPAASSKLFDDLEDADLWK
jgi:hypothetical protein